MNRQILHRFWRLVCLLFVLPGLSNQYLSAQCSGLVLNITAPSQTSGSWTVPSGGPYKIKITTKGGKGGTRFNNGGGRGASIIGEFIVTSGMTLQAAAGIQGASAESAGSSFGGNGSAVSVSGTPIIVAGGGGGTGSCGCNGGAGQITINGENGGGCGGAGGTNGGDGAPGISPTSPGQGGKGYANGMIGGAGLSGFFSGGGGGGYSGGGGGGCNGPGGGGGSYNTGINQVNTAGANNGPGQVIIECLGPAVLAATVTPTAPATCGVQGSVSVDITGIFNGSTTELEYAIAAGGSFAGSPTFADLTADPLNLTSGFGTTTGTYTMRIRVKNFTSIFVDQTYTIGEYVDNVPPSITCPLNVPFTTNFGTCGALFYYSISISDNCFGQTWAQNSGQASGTTFPVGLTENSFIATDAAGNTATCAFTVTVEDHENPSAICQNVTVQLDAGGTALISAASVDAGSSDACGIGNLSLSNSNFSCENIGANTVTLTVTDNHGNTSTCNATVTVEDNIPPSVVCHAFSIAVNAIGVELDDIYIGSSDNCNIDDYLLSQTTFTCQDVGDNIVVFTATDQSGNSSSCTAIITVTDELSPSALCQGVTVQLNSGGSASISANDIDAGSNDDCGIANLALSNSSFSCQNVGASIVTLTVTDVNGNTATCTAIVTVEDNQAPQFTNCPSNIPCIEATSPAGAFYQYTPQITDNCSNVTVSYSQSPTGTFPLGQTTITVFANDASNQTTCTFDINVCDNTPPTISNTPSNIPCVEATSPAGAVVFYTNPTASDIVDGAVSVVCIPASGSTFPVGTSTVVCTATDANGNSVSTSFTIDICDTTPPVIVGTPSNIPCVEATSPAGAVVFYTSPAASDIVDGAVSVVCVLTSGSTFPIGTNTVVCTAVDAHGNASSTSFTIDICDTTPPVIVGTPSNIPCVEATSPAGAAVFYTNPTASDIVDPFAVVTCVLPSGSTFAIGTNTVVCTSADIFGNSASTSFTIEVCENTSPTLTCPNNIAQNTDPNQCSAVVNFDAPTATDVVDGNIPPVQTGGQASGSAFSLGSTLNTFTATDSYGNSATCSFTVTISDNEVPAAICQNLTINLDEAGEATISENQIDDGSTDNCAVSNLSVSQTNFDCSDLGANTVTLTATDASGNSATCNASVTVEDNIAPTITCPANITQNNASGQCSKIVSFVATATDNCSATVMQTGGLSSGAAFPVGTSVVTFKATDAGGSTATCSFSVNILLSADPALIHAYTAIGLDEVKMKKNTVFAGGVGTVKAGKAVKLEQTTLITAPLTFVKAPVLQKQSGSQVTTYIPGQVAASILPAFQTTQCNNCQNDLYVPTNGSATASLACYEHIKVGKNATLTFSGQAIVNIEELEIEENATVLFNQNTTIRIKDDLEIDDDATVSNNGNRVQFFVEEHVKIEEGVHFTANVRTLKHIQAQKASAAKPTVLTGLFIAEKIDAKEFVHWYRDENGCGTPPPPPGGGNLVAQNKGLAFSSTKSGEAETKLNWIRLQDETDDFFVVERSSDGQNFSPILKTDASGNAGEIQYFSELDKKPLAGENFYRLKLVSKIGDEKVSNVEKVVFPRDGFSVYPNPTSGNSIFISMKNLSDEAADVQLVNAFGQVLQTRNFEKLPDAPLQWHLENLPSGTYFFKVKMAGEREITRRFVLQRP